MKETPAKKNKFEFNFHGRAVTFELDQLATKSDKSILGRYGNTTVLTVLMVKELPKNRTATFFPLTISVEEKFYAVGRIPTGFNKREGKPSHDAITTARLIDRTLRSFFPLGGNQEVQIINHILSVDPECDPTLVATWNSSLVCLLSPLLPYFSTPLATVIVGEQEKKLLGNPRQKTPLELIVSATEEKIVMLEMGAPEITEERLIQAVAFAQQEIRYLIGFFQHIANTWEVKKEKLKKEEGVIVNEWLAKKTNDYLTEVLLNPKTSWWEKEQELKECRQQLSQEYYQNNPELGEEYIADLVEKLGDGGLKKWMSEIWKSQQRRLDGRSATTIRPLTIQIDYLPAVHGSALFGRGDTKVLSVITIGKISEKQLTDNIFSRSHKHFIHHYNFPSFAVNEIVSYRGVSRREIGHGELVEKTFDYLIPPVDLFPYTVRAVSEVFASDGSSSQASICATSLALMAAGVPLIRPVAGIALGLFEGQIYSDISGLEDKLGEMDFKIAGTEKGICSWQLDVKNQGISAELLKECCEKARLARIYLLDEMKKILVRSRPNLPVQVIKCRRLAVEKKKISWIIGPGGKTINQLTTQTGTTIEIQPDGHLLIYHPEEKQLEKVEELIREILTRKNN